MLDRIDVVNDFLKFSTAQLRRSVGKINCQEEYVKFLRINRNERFVLQPKFDGCNLLVKVVKGEIAVALSRNNNDVTDKLRGISVYGLGEFDGFALGELVNIKDRVLASGCLHRKNINGLDLNDYALFIFQSYDENTRKWVLNEDISEPFDVNEGNNRELSSITVVKEYMGYPCDGVILKSVNNALISVAYKGLNLWHEVVIDRIEIKKGSSGKITPVCYFEPFKTANGKLLSSLSAFSMDTLKKMKISVGCVAVIKTESNGDFPVLCGKKDI